MIKFRHPEVAINHEELGELDTLHPTAPIAFNVFEKRGYVSIYVARAADKCQSAV